MYNQLIYLFYIELIDAYIQFYYVFGKFLLLEKINLIIGFLVVFSFECRALQSLRLFLGVSCQA